MMTSPFPEIGNIEEIFISHIAMLTPGKSPELIMRRIQAEVCKAKDISLGFMLSGCRNRKITDARQFAMWRIAKETTLSYVQIGKGFNKHHTTVLHAFEKIEGAPRFPYKEKQEPKMKQKNRGNKFPSLGGQPSDYGFIKELTSEERHRLYAGRTYGHKKLHGDSLNSGAGSEKPALTFLRVAE